MLFPYKDDNPRILVPYVTYALLAANVLVFIYQQILPGPVIQHAFALRFGLIPAYLWGGEAQTILEYNRDLFQNIYPPGALEDLRRVQLLPGIIGLFTSPFLHSGWMHIIGNMLFLYVFADNVEGALGHLRFGLFYVFTALAAGLLHAAVLPGNMVPVVGASGAISGVLGAYLVRYPRARIHVLVFIVFFITTLKMPAIVVLGLWFLVQAVNGLISLQMQASGGVAWFEHIGGFAAGFSFMAITSRGRKFPLKYG
jgi:membrane associated rhomboid family serine protease